MRRVVVLLALTMLAAGCGDSGSSDSSKPTTTTTAEPSPKPTTTTVATTTTTAAPAEPELRLLSEEELTSSLLRVQDLPVGYSQDPPDGDQPMKTFCDYKPPFTEKQYVTRDFTKGGGMSSEFLSIGLRQYATADEANAAFDAMADAIGSCPGDTFQGTELTYAPMSAPKIGDASVGVRITADGTDLLQFFVLTGPTIIRTGGGGLMNANLDEVTKLLEAQLAAYETAATS